MHALGPTVAQFLSQGPAGEVQPELVEVSAELVRVRLPDEHGGRIGHYGEAPFSRLHRLFQLLALGNVLPGANDRLRLPLVIPDQLHVVPHPAVAAVRMAEPVFANQGAGRGQGVQACLGHHKVLGMDMRAPEIRGCQEGGRRVAQSFLHILTDESGGHAVRGTQRKDDHRRVSEQELHPVIAVAQSGFRLLARGDGSDLLGQSRKEPLLFLEKRPGIRLRPRLQVAHLDAPH